MKPREIYAAVSAATNVPVSDILGDCRFRHIVKARFMAARLLLTDPERHRTLPQVGRELGRDHTTVINAIKRADHFVVTDPKFRKQFEQAQSILGITERRPVFRTSRLTNLTLRID